MRHSCSILPPLLWLQYSLFQPVALRTADIFSRTKHYQIPSCSILDLYHFVITLTDSSWQQLAETQTSEPQMLMEFHSSSPHPSDSEEISTVSHNKGRREKKTTTQYFKKTPEKVVLKLHNIIIQQHGKVTQCSMNYGKKSL